MKPTYGSRYNATGLPTNIFAGGTRALASDIYNLFAADAAAPGGPHQRGFPLHRLEQDEVWHFYDGDGPVDLFLFDFETGGVATPVVGRVPDGGVPQFAVPGGAWAGALLAADTTWCMTGAQTTPAFDPRDSTMAATNATLVQQFLARFPGHRSLIKRLIAF